MCYTLLRFEHYKPGEQRFGRELVKHAVVMVHETGNEWTLNHRLFDGVELGTHFVFGDNHEILRITEEQIPVEVQKIKDQREEARLEALRIREANIATGRFIYEEHKDSYRPGSFWQIQREIISEDHADFKRVAFERLNQGRTQSLGPTLASVSMGSSSRLDEFLALAQEGDRLELVNAYRDPLAASTDFSLVRGGKSVAHYNISVS